MRLPRPASSAGKRPKIGFAASQPVQIEVPVTWTEILRIEEGRGLRVDCRQGHVWVTQTNDAQDHLLGPGEELVVGSGNRVLVVGMPEATVRVVG